MSDRIDQISFPLIVSEGLDIAFFDSIEALETALEGIDVDVADGIYKAYDADGRKLTLEAIGVMRGFMIVTSVGIVKLAGAETIPSHQNELSELLRTYLSSLGYPSTEEHELSQLVSLSIKAAANRST